MVYKFRLSEHKYFVVSITVSGDRMMYAQFVLDEVFVDHVNGI